LPSLVIESVELNSPRTVKKLFSLNELIMFKNSTDKSFLNKDILPIKERSLTMGSENLTFKRNPPKQNTNTFSFVELRK